MRITYLYTLIILFMATLCCYSQNHMKFMGLSIDGHVDSFSQKLISKGFSKENGDVPNAYCLAGKFYDEEAHIQVNYDPSNHIVYSVSVYIIKNALISAYSIQREILRAIEDKYKYEKKSVNPTLYQSEYYIFDGLDPVGLIQTFIIDSKIVPTNKEAMLSIIYTDVENYLNYENRKRNDI